jgi:hypothetical protein
MTPRSALAVAVAVVALLLGGCSDPSSSGAASVPGHGSAAPEDTAAAAAKGAKGHNGPPGTSREKFMPVLKRAYQKVTWPKAYTMTMDDIWGFMAAGAQDTAYGERDATDMVTIWNTCAWTLELIDDTKAGKSVDEDSRSLVFLKNDSNREIIERILDDAKLGELGTARQFVTANGCQKGFQN